MTFQWIQFVWEYHIGVKSCAQLSGGHFLADLRKWPKAKKNGF